MDAFVVECLWKSEEDIVVVVYYDVVVGGDYDGGYSLIDEDSFDDCFGYFGDDNGFGDC